MIKEVTLPIDFTPYKWQVESFRKFVDNGLESFVELADVGTGKTAETITKLRYLKQVKYPQGIKILIIGPTVVIHNWTREVVKYSVEKGELGRLFPLADAKKRVTEMSEIAHRGYHGVVVTNYESFDNEVFTSMVSKWRPHVIVCDELHRLKNYKSKRAKTIVSIRPFADVGLGLTGSSILNSPMDLFMQWKFLDNGKTFGSNFFNFRNKYFFDANARWAGRPGYFPKWDPIPELFGELSEKIQYNSIRVVKSECMDLPPFIVETIKLQMGAKQRKAYEQMQKDFIAFIETGGEVLSVSVAQLALTKALRLMQIASGFVSIEGAENGEGVVFGDNPKLDALEKIIEDNPEAKIIVWCSYKANYKAIGERLDKIKIPHVFITGEQNAEEKQAAIDAFQNDPKIRVTVNNRKAGGIGINLTSASISVVFSRNFSLEEEIQSDGRNYRGGSQIHEKITKINLVMEDTIEEQIIEALSNKSNISEMILNFKNTIAKVIA
jgi:SNF2 family DNA or RNA helicase